MFDKTQQEVSIAWKEFSNHSLNLTIWSTISEGQALIFRSTAAGDMDSAAMLAKRSSMPKRICGEAGSPSKKKPSSAAPRGSVSTKVMAVGVEVILSPKKCSIIPTS